MGRGCGQVHRSDQGGDLHPAGGHLPHGVVQLEIPQRRHRVEGQRKHLRRVRHIVGPSTSSTENMDAEISQIFIQEQFLKKS